MTAGSEAGQFARGYAAVYDLLYHDKDYGQECDLLARLWSRFSERPPRRLLDLGCGTGGHAVPLAQRGYEVTGIDISEGMIEVARQKGAGAGVRATFEVMPMQRLDLGTQRFDVVTCMFQAINYVVREDDLRQVLQRVRQHLAPGGLFLFDFRNGVPSIREYSPVRYKQVEKNGRTLLRVSETELDAMEQLFRTTYTNLVVDGDRVVERLTDVHNVRFFYPREVRWHLESLGYEVLAMTAFPEIERAATEDDWDVMVVARTAAAPC